MADNESEPGRNPRVTDTDLLEVFRSTSDPVLSTAEVSDALPIKRRGTLNRLRGLEEDGTLDSKQIGGRNTVWWLLEEAESGRESEPASEEEIDYDKYPDDLPEPLLGERIATDQIDPPDDWPDPVQTVEDGPPEEKAHTETTEDE